MTKPKNSKNTPVCAQQKVRNYVMSLLYHRTSESIRIPSYNEIAPKLGVARSSVQLALKQLIQEGYLTAKVGIGTFSNPQKSVSYRFHDQRLPIIGVVVGDGKFVYYLYSVWLTISAVGDALAHRCFDIQMLNLCSYTEESILKELEDLKLEGIVWIKPAQSRLNVIRRLAAQIPTVVCSGSVPEVDSVYFDHRAEGESIACELLRQHRRHWVASCCFSYEQTKIDAIRDRFREAGVSLDHCVIFDNQERFARQLETMLDKGDIPDALLINPEETAPILQLLARHKVAIPQQCLVISGMFALHDAQAPLTVQPLNYRAIGEQAVTLLENRFRDPSHPRQEFVIDAEPIQSYNP